MLDLSATGDTLAIDRTYTAGEIRETTKTRKGRDVPIVAPLAADLMTQWDSIEHDPDALVWPLQTGTPINPSNRRRRSFDPAAAAAVDVITHDALTEAIADLEADVARKEAELATGREQPSPGLGLTS